MAVAQGTCREKVGLTADDTGTSMKHPGTQPHLLVTKRSLAKLLENRSLERLVEDQAEVRIPQAGGTRRRRRGLPWPFARRRGSSAAAEAAGQSGSGGRGALFGRPLAALCSQDGTLPQPIQDLLALLAEHGPSTEGIFRLAVKEHVSRELREALDSGAEVHLASQPAHLLAVLLKDFLRKIPSKLLGAELYEEWMSALQKTSRQEKLAALREVAGKLPQANLLLLKSLLSLLQRISRNAASSRMTAGNLAICVGPNLLSPPEEQTLPLDTLVQVTGQVRRVYQPAPAVRAQPSFGVQRCLGASSLQQRLGGAARKSSPTSAAFCAEARVRSGKAFV
ncbi:T-cell activation Rho GTPase-activating protein-like [Balearica regulorum gibbericeps]|uniref:T-cell activation Rho GTPase-activating protein-like n=1 Tax=Balearica regulorum gibbericeps TaxID=100784 RepID=UPI003F5FD2C0